MTPVLTHRWSCPAVTIVSGSELAPVQFAEVLAILAPNWHDTDPYLDQISRVMDHCAREMLVRISNGRIDGVLRTKGICTGGDPRRVPATFEQLVGPHWSRHDANPDTRILVDLTRLDGASGVARSLVPACLDRFVEPNVGTFSPEDAAALHTHFGANPVRRIENARPRHSPPHVVVMRYRGFPDAPDSEAPRVERAGADAARGIYGGGSARAS